MTDRDVVQISDLLVLPQPRLLRNSVCIISVPQNLSCKMCSDKIYPIFIAALGRLLVTFFFFFAVTDILICVVAFVGVGDVFLLLACKRTCK